MTDFPYRSLTGTYQQEKDISNRTLCVDFSKCEWAALSSDSSPENSKESGTVNFRSEGQSLIIWLTETGEKELPKHKIVHLEVDRENDSAKGIMFEEGQVVYAIEGATLSMKHAD